MGPPEALWNMARMVHATRLAVLGKVAQDHGIGLWVQESDTGRYWVSLRAAGDDPELSVVRGHQCRDLPCI